MVTIPAASLANSSYHTRSRFDQSLLIPPSPPSLSIIAHHIIMPGPSKSGQALFLGLELSTDQLRATIVDENLELVGVEAVDFDTALSEYQ